MVPAGLLVSAITWATRTPGLWADDLRIGDLFYVALVVWVLVLRVERGPLRGRPIGQRWVGIWLATLGISLYPVLVSSLGLSTTPLIAWLRLVQTISLLWLIPYAVRTVEDVEFTLGVVALATTRRLAGRPLDRAASWQRRFPPSRQQRSKSDRSACRNGHLDGIAQPCATTTIAPRSDAHDGITALLLTRSVGSLAAVALTLGTSDALRPRSY